MVMAYRLCSDLRPRQSKHLNYHPPAALIEQNCQLSLRIGYQRVNPAAASSYTLHHENGGFIMLAVKRSGASLLESYFKTFPRVAVLGVRQCGWTTLLQTLPAGWSNTFRPIFIAT